MGKSHPELTSFTICTPLTGWEINEHSKNLPGIQANELAMCSFPKPATPAKEKKGEDKKSKNKKAKADSKADSKWFFEDWVFWKDWKFKTKIIVICLVVILVIAIISALVACCCCCGEDDDMYDDYSDLEMGASRYLSNHPLSRHRRMSKRMSCRSGHSRTGGSRRSNFIVLS